MSDDEDPENTIESSESIYEQGLNKGTIYYNNMRLANSYKFDTFDIAKDLEQFKSFNCIITSKTNSGKSVLMNDICYRIKDWYNSVYVFSMTSYLQPDLFTFVPKENIIRGFSEERLEEIWNRQERLVMELKKSKVKDDSIPRILILYDDLISDPNVRNSPILKRMFVAGRHAKISQIFLTQSFTAVPPVLRKNVALAIAFYLDNYDDREAFARSYLSTQNIKLGVMVFDRITKEPYTSICVLNCKVTQNPEEYIKTFKASLKIPKFKISGSKVKMSHAYLPFSPSSDLGSTPLELKISKSVKSVKV